MTAILTPIPTGVFLCTLAQVKERYGIARDVDDDRINGFIAKATERINNEYCREFVPGSSGEIRTFDVNSRIVDLFSFDLRAAETVILHPEAEEPVTLVQGADYALRANPLTGTYGKIRLSQVLSLSSEYAANFGYARLEVTGNWGVWESTAEVAEDVNDAAIITVGSWISRPAAQMTGYPADLGVGQAIVPTATPGFDIPFQAHLKLQRYKAQALAVF